MLFTRHQQLKDKGILGMNSRNLDYIFPNNPRCLYPLVDDKFLTKQLAIKAGIPTPELYATIEYQGHVSRFDELTKKHKHFVLKPASGSGGSGILVIEGHSSQGYKKANGEYISHDAIKYHVSNILSGLYSLGGQSDKAIIEYKVEFDPVFKHVSYKGVPDIRVIIYHGVPVMGMVRLPTHESDGKANLHIGGVGVGIDMKTGITTSGVQHNNSITHHPDTEHPIAGIQIPNWIQLLKMASQFYDLTKLGYVGVDIVLDKDKGPMMLELNARPGLAIQIANNRGLGEVLEKVTKNLHKVKTVDERVALALEIL
jgi:alpha-L-glutamate ligase-like protein